VRYIKRIVNYVVKYCQVQYFKLVGFPDWIGSLDYMKRSSEYYFSMGLGVFSWCSMKQEVVAQSTIEVEFIAVVAAMNQAIWLRNILIDFCLKQDKSTNVFVDN